MVTLVRANLTRVTSKLNFKTVSVLPSPALSLIFPFYLLPSPVQLTPDFPSVSSLASLSFLSCCHLTTTHDTLKLRVINPQPKSFQVLP